MTRCESSTLRSQGGTALCYILEYVSGSAKQVKYVSHNLPTNEKEGMYLRTYVCDRHHSLFRSLPYKNSECGEVSSGAVHPFWCVSPH